MNVKLKKYYPDTISNPDFPLLERKIIKFWQGSRIFDRSVEERSINNCFVCYDGPPFANGMPHYGHLLTGFVKDTFARYQTMLQKRVERKFGWDCHGLPAEMYAENELGISGRNEIEKFGIEKFNNYCSTSVMKFSSEWEEYVNRQARWVDFHNGYKTMDKSFMESVIWAFKQLYNKGLVYESFRVVPYSWACETPLSNFETKLDNSYRKKTSKAVTVAFELLKNPKQLKQKCKLLAWTTTPWTLPSNLALAIGKNIQYDAVSVQCLDLFKHTALKFGENDETIKKSSSIMRCSNTQIVSDKSEQYDEIYIFAESYLEEFIFYCKQNNIQYKNYNIKLKSDDLAGLSYKPLFDYFQNTKNAFRIFIADYVTEECGTGVVHTAPGFGEDDFYLCQSNNIQPICPIDNGGKFTSEVYDLAGVHVLDANDLIIRKLKEKGNWFKTEQYIHSYPHCWRTDTPLIYRTMPSWYIAVTKLKEKMIEVNKRVNWIPNHIRDGQFGKWLEGARDWSISRNRFWGTPIPVWKSDDKKYPRVDVYGSIEELERDFNVKIHDLHRPFIDTLTRPNINDPTGKSIMRRVPDVFDCWFESGSMPFAQVHYPFENKEWFKKNFPADLITEYISQTRGWFYTLFVLSTALFNSEPFKNCICHGVVLDIKGQKLSKRLNNYPDPMEIFDKYGADSLRFFMLSRSVVCGGDLLLDKKGNAIRDILKNVIKRIWNSYHFFTIYANADGIKAEVCKHYQNTMDRYLLSKCFEVVETVQVSMNNYNCQQACKSIVDFFEVLNNWYIRRNRERFWKSNLDKDKSDAYNVIYTVFYYMLRISAPLLPFITESIWQGLQYNEISVHLAKFPELEKFDSNFIAKMDLVRDICKSALSIRHAFNIRIRQPLCSMIIYHQSFHTLLGNKEIFSSVTGSYPIVQNDTWIQYALGSNEYLGMIKDEVNVKELQLVNTLEGIASLELKLNFSLLGKKVPSKIKKLVKYARNGRWRQVENEQIFLGGDGLESFIIEKGEYELLLKANSKYSSLFDNNKGIVILNTELNDDLVLEGLVRDITRLIQETRKQANLHMSDIIKIVIKTDDEKIKAVVNAWSWYIKKQTLAVSLEIKTEIEKNFYLKVYQDLIVGIKLYS